MIHLHAFAPLWGLVDISPFVTKLDVYLRLARLPYKLVPFSIESFTAAPKGKLPYIVDGHERIADSSFIVDYLKEKYGEPLDAKLGLSERAAGHAIKRMLEENLYWVIVAERWRDTKTAVEQYPVMVGQPPEFVKGVVDNLRGELRGHGMGRHSVDEVEGIGKADLTALSDFLGAKPFLLGSDPTSYDATTFSFVAHTIQPEYASRMKTFVKTLPNLTSKRRVGKGALFARRAHADGVAAGSASLFSVFTGQVPHVAAPIRRQVAACNILFETAMRPIAGAANESMLHGIEMNIIDVSLKVGIVPDRVLPIPPLPQAALALPDLARRVRDIDGQSSRKAALDQAPAQRKIGVIWRKLPDRVNMVRQDANRHGFERPALLHASVDAS
jgi:glutathione S-transferase